MSLPTKQKGKVSFQHAESILVLGFLAVIMLGTVLLVLPGAAKNGVDRVGCRCYIEYQKSLREQAEKERHPMITSTIA